MLFIPHTSFFKDGTNNLAVTKTPNGMEQNSQRSHISISHVSGIWSRLGLGAGFSEQSITEWITLFQTLVTTCNFITVFFQTEKLSRLRNQFGFQALSGTMSTTGQLFE